MNNYTNALLRAPKLAFAAMVFTLLLKIAAIILMKLLGHGTAFDEAVDLLIHYPQNTSSIFAFFAAVMFFLAITLIFYPSEIGEIFCRKIFIPSLHITEHMLSLSFGVLVAWAIIDIAVGKVDSGEITKIIGTVAFGALMLGTIAVICSVIAEFLSTDFEAEIKKLGSL
jgi:hypothetical protein